jgi:hypothetical protein
VCRRGAQQRPQIDTLPSQLPDGIENWLQKSAVLKSRARHCMLELPSASQTGVLKRHTGVYQRHTWAVPTAFVQINRNVATLLLLAAVGMLNPHEARLAPRQYPLDCALVGKPHQRMCSHEWDAVEHTKLMAGQLLKNRYGDSASPTLNPFSFMHSWKRCDTPPGHLHINDDADIHTCMPARQDGIIGGTAMQLPTHVRRPCAIPNSACSCQAQLAHFNTTGYEGRTQTRTGTTMHIFLPHGATMRGSKTLPEYPGTMAAYAASNGPASSQYSCEFPCKCSDCMKFGVCVGQHWRRYYNTGAEPTHGRAYWTRASHFVAQQQSSNTGTVTQTRGWALLHQEQAIQGQQPHHGTYRSCINSRISMHVAVNALSDCLDMMPGSQEHRAGGRTCRKPQTQTDPSALIEVCVIVAIILAAEGLLNSVTSTHGRRRYMLPARLLTGRVRSASDLAWGAAPDNAD